MFLAGGIGRGEALLAFLEMGASGAQVGTRFAAASESIAHPNFKQAFIGAHARDVYAALGADGEAAGQDFSVIYRAIAERSGL